MSHTGHVVLIVTGRLRTGQEAAFHKWVAKRDLIVEKSPGFVGTDLIPPIHRGENAWTIITNFGSSEALKAWQTSVERENIRAEGGSIFLDGSLSESVQDDGASGATGTDAGVTEVIFSKILPGMETDYRNWSSRMQAEQAAYPGYRGMYLQPPDEAGGLWTTIIRFDSAAHLEGWMNAPERATMLRESRAFIEHEQFTRLATSFPGWVPVDPSTGKGPPNWKTAMLVLLGLFPIVMLEMRFFSAIMPSLHVNNSSLAIQY